MTRSALQLGLLSGLVVLGAVLLAAYNTVDYDVAYLTWAAHAVAGGAVYGVDVLDINPPLCLLVYMPAALLADAVGFEWGVRLAMLALSLLSLACLWHTAETPLRPAVCAVFVAFLLLAYPNHFAQREQIAFLLCAPYVAGPARRRGWAIASGAMAGIGFLMKPHFLIPLALLLALRRQFRNEERSMLAVAAAYALVLAIFFRPYLLVMLPAARASYWAVAFPWRETVVQAGFVLLAALPLAVAGAQRGSIPFLLAALGFTAAAVLQGKGFYYHYIAAFGFLAMFLAANLNAGNRLIAACAATLLVMEAVFLARLMLPWFALQAQTAADRQAIQREIDGSASFISLAIQPGIAFPAVIHTGARYLGLSSCQGYMSAVEQYATGKASGDPAAVYRLALDQATRELLRRPELVLVAQYGQDNAAWDMLGWYQRDAGFRDLWKDYRRDRSVGPVTFYRRSALAP